MSRKSWIFFLSILIGFGLVFRFVIFPFLPISPDQSTLEEDYTLENAFPNLSFNQIVDLQFPNDTSNELYVVQQNGQIFKFQNSKETSSKTLFLDITDQVASGGEMGLLGLAFHPKYSETDYFYVDYTLDDPRRTRIARFSTTIDGLADPNSEFIILEVDQPYSNHNAGGIAFGPDGFLYITLGDGGLAGDPQNNGQDPTTLLGSILRIDVNNQENGLNYSIPEDNPFVQDSSKRGEIWAYGLRNPWRISFDPETGNLFAGDVGQNKYEEVDLIEKGKNYGWNIMEGFHCYRSSNCSDEGLTLPLIEYGRSLGKSITGGYVYRGNIETGLFGNYIFADYISGWIWYFDVNNLENPEMNELLKFNENYSSFGVDQNMELYVLEYSGIIYDIVENN